MNQGRSLRRAAVVVVGVAVVVLVLVLGRDDAPTRFTGPPPGDPVAAMCRSSSDRSSSACQSAYFACRDHRSSIVRDAGLPRSTRGRTVAAAYVASDWGDWEGAVREAAGRGCRAGLRGR